MGDLAVHRSSDVTCWRNLTRLIEPVLIRRNLDLVVRPPLAIHVHVMRHRLIVMIRTHRPSVGGIFNILVYLTSSILCGVHQVI